MDVAIVGHHNAAQRARQIADGEDAECLDLAQPVRSGGGEEQLSDDRREEDEDDEVVELECAAERGEQEYTTFLRGYMLLDRRLSGHCTLFLSALSQIDFLGPSTPDNCSYSATGA